MALKWQNIPLDLSGGIDTKTADKMIPAGKLSVLENGEFIRPGSIRKRPGSVAIGKQSTNYDNVSSEITSASGVIDYGKELVLKSGSRLWSRSEINGSWLDRGEFIDCRALIGKDTLARDNNSALIISHVVRQSVVHCAGVVAVAVSSGYPAGSYTSVWELRDEKTNALLARNFALGTRPTKIINIRDRFIGFIYENLAATALEQVWVDTAVRPLAFGSASALITTTTNLYFDVDVDRVGKAWAVAVASDGTTGIRVVKFSENSIDYTPVVHVDGGTVSAAPLCVALNEAQDQAICLYKTATPAIRSVGINPVDGSAIWSAANVDTGATVKTAAAVYDPDVSGKYIVVIQKDDPETAAPSGALYGVDLATVSAAGTPTAKGFVTGWGYIASKPWVFDGKPMLLIANAGWDYKDSYYVTKIIPSTQATATATNRGRPVAKILQNEVARFIGGAGALPGWQWTTTDWIDNNRLSVGLVHRIYATSGASATSGTDGLARVVIDLNQQNKITGIKQGGALYVAGGLLTVYSGVHVSEFSAIEQPHLQVPTATTGTLSAGTYSMRCCAVWTDDNGVVQRSAPSVPVTYVSAGSDGFSARIQTGILTNRDADVVRTSRQNTMHYEIYCTKNNGSIHYFVNLITGLTTAPKNVSTAVTNTPAGTSRILYTDGGTLDNITPPAIRAAVEFKNRLIVQVGDYRIWYSRKIVPPEGPAFSDLLFRDVPTYSGEITTLARIDEYCVIFCERGVFYFTGDGPTDAGTNDTFSEFRQIASDVGAIPGSPVAVTDQGIFFYTIKGIYLLNRSLQPSYIGAPVDRYNGIEMVSANVIANRHQVRFALVTGEILVFDYQEQQWSVFTTPMGVAQADTWQGDYVRLGNDGTVYVDQADTYTDGGSAYPLRLVSAWIQPAGRLAWQRIRRLSFLGSKKTTHKLRLKLYYDFEETPLETIIIDNSAAFPVGNGLLKHSVRLSRQKCTAFRFEIEDFDQTGSGEGYELNSFTLEVGAKTGIFKDATEI